MLTLTRERVGIDLDQDGIVHAVLVLSVERSDPLNGPVRNPDLHIVARLNNRRAQQQSLDPAD